MKIGDARAVYNNYYDQLTKRYVQLSKQAEKEQAADKKEEAGVTLELSQEVLKKREEIGKFARFDMPDLIAGMENEKLAPYQAEAQKDMAINEVRIMEVARRIASGAKVPASDEKKLMEYNFKLYLAVKNAAMIGHDKDKKYESLWDDEEEKKDYPGMDEIDEEINNTELCMDLPEMDLSLLGDTGEE